MFAYAKSEQKQAAKSTVQKKEADNKSEPNLTGIPNEMKSKFESRSGFSFSDVRVHYNSDKPAQLQALAYTQGNQVYVAPGQEKHLGHELGHVVQQKQGRVHTTAHINGFCVNDDPILESEADNGVIQKQTIKTNSQVIQRVITPNQQNEADIVLEEQGAGLEIALYGDEHRDVLVQGDDAQPQNPHGVYEGSKRIDDAPVWESIRRYYNKIDNYRIYFTKFLEQNDIRRNHIDFNFDWREPVNVITEIKQFTKTFYKATFRRLEYSDEEIAGFQADFLIFLDNKEQQLRDMLDNLTALIVDMNQLPVEPIDLQTATDVGEDIWRADWLRKVQLTNEIIDGAWGAAQGQINAWWQINHNNNPLAPMHLTYIGSLAKGYKGPPKQHVRFDTESFDVDANLDSPELANYAVTIDGLVPDRGKILARQTTIQELIDFCDIVNDFLLATFGNAIDVNDPFDVAILVPNSVEIAGNPAFSPQVLALVQNQEGNETATTLLYDLRQSNPVAYQGIYQALQMNNLIDPNTGGLILMDGADLLLFNNIVNLFL